MNAPLIIFGRRRIADMVRQASELTGVPEEDILGGCRHQDAVLIRFAIMCAAREIGRSSKQIGRVLGLDHSTVLYGVFRARKLELVDPDFATLLARLRDKPCCPVCGRLKEVAQ